MFKKLNKKIIGLGLTVISLAVPSLVYAADIVVEPLSGQPYGAHEIWAHSEMGQSFVAEASNVKGGFFVSYSPESAALMAPNASSTELIVNLYEGEALDSAKLLYTKSFVVDTTQNGYLDTDYVNAGIQLVPGNKYTLGISSPFNRGWIVPSVCVYPAGGQPTGAYDNGHPFFNGQIVTNEVGICDNAFHVIESLAIITPVPVSPTPSPTPIPASSYSVTNRKVELKGVVTVVNFDNIVVKGKVVYFDSNTVIKWNYNNTFAVDQKVQIKGFKNSDGSITATVIEVQ